MGTVAKSTRCFFFSYSLYDAFSNKRIRRIRERFIEVSTLKQIQKSCGIQFKTTLKSFALTEVVYSIAKRIFDSTSFDPSRFGSPELRYVDIVFTYPVLEELVFRGVLQNTIWAVQELSIYSFNINKKSSRICRWIVSPSFRVIITQLTFATLHLGNAGSYVSTAGAVTQFVNILFLNTTFPLLYEATDNFLVPVSTHITNNLMTTIVLVALESIGR